MLRAASEFDKKLGPFGPATSNQYLYTTRHAPSGLSCGIFQEEPAIAGLDGFFATNPRSEEYFDCNTPADLHPAFGWTSPCPGLDRPASGLILVTHRLLRRRPLHLRAAGTLLSLRLLSLN